MGRCIDDDNDLILCGQDIIQLFFERWCVELVVFIEEGVSRYFSSQFLRHQVIWIPVPVGCKNLIPRLRVAGDGIADGTGAARRIAGFHIGVFRHFIQKYGFFHTFQISGRSQDRRISCIILRCQGTDGFHDRIQHHKLTFII